MGVEEDVEEDVGNGGREEHRILINFPPTIDMIWDPLPIWLVFLIC